MFGQQPTSFLLREDLRAVTGSPCAPITVATVGKSPIAKKIVVEQIVVNPDNSHYSHFGANR